VKVVLTHTMRTRMFTCERKALLGGLMGFRETKRKPAFRLGTNFDRLSGRTASLQEVAGEYFDLVDAAVEEQDRDELLREFRVVEALAQLYDEVFPPGKEERSNLKFRHPILSPSGRAHPRIEAGGELDGFSEEDGGTLIERKTTGLTLDQRGRFLGTDNQLKAYVFGAKEGLGLVASRISYRIARKPRLRQKKNESSSEFSERVVESIASSPTEYMGEARLPTDWRQTQGFRLHLWESARRFNDLLMRARKVTRPLSLSGSDLLESFRSEGLWNEVQEDSGTRDKLIELYPCNSSACSDYGGCEFFDFCSTSDTSFLSSRFSRSRFLNPELQNA